MAETRCARIIVSHFISTSGAAAIGLKVNNTSVVLPVCLAQRLVAVSLLVVGVIDSFYHVCLNFIDII